MNLLNLHLYTVPQLAFYATGAYLWVIAYLVYIRNGFKQGVVETIQSAYTCQMPISFLYIPLDFDYMYLLTQRRRELAASL